MSNGSQSINRMSRRPSMQYLIVVGAALAVLVVVGASFYFLGRPSSSSDCNPPAPAGLSGTPDYVLAPCRTTVEVSSHSFVSYQVVRITDGETVEGEYAATHAPSSPVWVYVLNSTEFSALPAAISAPPSNFYWAAPAGSVGNFSVQVPGSPAQFYVVLVDVGDNGFSVQWRESLVIYYVLPQGSN